MVFKLLFLFIFSFLVFSQPSTVSAHLGEALSVSLTDQGFEPSTITIHQGNSVVFKNSGQKPHWPASDIHPTHGVYPEFDPKKELQPFETWEFKFEKTGEWKFHDHLYPNFTGIIIVEASENYQESVENKNIIRRFFDSVKLKLTSLISETRANFDKLSYKLFPGILSSRLEKTNMLEVANDEASLTSWLKIVGAEKVLDKLLKDSGGGATIDCHQQSHQIGRISYELFGAEVFQYGDASCHSGYYHGAMEGFLKEKGTENIAENITKLCESFDTGFGHFECLHGTGHGVLAYEQYDLPQAIEVCKRLNDGFATSSCYGGLFMENIVTAQGLGAIKNHETKWVNQTDPHFPCNTFKSDSSILYECYIMQTSWMLTLLNYDFDKVAAECLKAVKAMVNVCFASYGRDAAGNVLRDPVKINELCNKVPKKPDYYKECMTGAENVIIDFWGPKLKEQASKYCDLQQGSYKEHCYSLLAGRLQDLFKTLEERKPVCATFEKDYQHLCQNS